jgi:hypothetical protein
MCVDSVTESKVVVSFLPVHIEHRMKFAVFWDLREELVSDLAWLTFEGVLAKRKHLIDLAPLLF